MVSEDLNQLLGAQSVQFEDTDSLADPVRHDAVTPDWADKASCSPVPPAYILTRVNS